MEEKGWVPEHLLPCEASPSDIWKGGGWLSSRSLPSDRENGEESFPWAPLSLGGE